MVKATFFSAESLLTGFELSGHAGGEEGTDIVCAAVSSAAYMAANTILEVLHLNPQVTLEDDGGFMKVVLNSEESAQAQDILRGFKLHLEGLSEQYPQNVKVKYGGVRNA